MREEQAQKPQGRTGQGWGVLPHWECRDKAIVEYAEPQGLARHSPLKENLTPTKVHKRRGSLLHWFPDVDCEGNRMGPRTGWAQQSDGQGPSTGRAFRVKWVRFAIGRVKWVRFAIGQEVVCERGTTGKS